MRNLLLLLLLSAITLAASTDSRGAPMRPQEYLSGNSIKVKQNGSKWTIRGGSREVTFNEQDFSMAVKAGGTWQMRPSQPDDLSVAGPEGAAALPLTQAARLSVSSYDTGRITGIKVVLAGFKNQDKELDCSLQLIIALEGRTEELVCEAIPVEGSAAITELKWPKAFVPGSLDATVVPAMQGMLVPAKWPKKVFLFDTVSYGRGLYMPWWGFQKGKSAAAVMLETPDDGGCTFEHPAGGPTLMEARWLASLGRMRYPRRARLVFQETGNYVTLAKRYRQHVIETGHFVSLRQKIARSPLVRKLIGSPVVHFGILTHIQPDSSYYHKDEPEKNHNFVSFDQRAAELQKLYDSGIKQAYVHLDGWGFRGYDNLHPDVLPPPPEGGGWDGMKRFGDVCDRLGYVFAIHDQYRDYYVDAASYSDSRTIVDAAGNRPFHSTWLGGKQSILCPSFVPGYVKRNHREILDQGVKLRGAYLDVFAVVPPDECFSPEHPATRSDCLKSRGDAFDLVRAQLGIASSEEPADWAIPYIDLVHHGPYALDPNPGGGEAMGVPIPLLNLVYHDALVMPWTASPGKGGWGIPNSDSGYLHALANGGIPYISTSPDEAEKQRIQTLCDLNRRVALQEMTDHEFLDSSYRKQRTAFADGTTVTVDFDSGEFSISN